MQRRAAASGIAAAAEGGIAEARTWPAEEAH